jgi:hypothetical protein
VANAVTARPAAASATRDRDSRLFMVKAPTFRPTPMGSAVQGDRLCFGTYPQVTPR